VHQERCSTILTLFQRAGVGFCSRPRRVGVATLRNHLAFARARKRPAMVRAFLHATTMECTAIPQVQADPCSLDAIAVCNASVLTNERAAKKCRSAIIRPLLMLYDLHRPFSLEMQPCQNAASY